MGITSQRKWREKRGLVRRPVAPARTQQTYEQQLAEQEHQKAVSLAGGGVAGPTTATFLFRGEQFTVETLQARLELVEEEIARSFRQLDGELNDARTRVTELETENEALKKDLAELNELLESSTSESEQPPAPAEDAVAANSSEPTSTPTAPTGEQTAPSEPTLEGKPADDSKGKKPKQQQK